MNSDSFHPCLFEVRDTAVLLYRTRIQGSGWVGRAGRLGRRKGLKVARCKRGCRTTVLRGGGIDQPMSMSSSKTERRNETNASFCGLRDRFIFSSHAGAPARAPLSRGGPSGGAPTGGAEMLQQHANWRVVVMVAATQAYGLSKARLCRTKYGELYHTVAVGIQS